MTHIPLLDEIAIIAAVAVVVAVVLARWRLPTVAGLLAAGALVGPFGLHWATSVHAIEVLAEVGVVLLLFTIGLEFSLDRLRDIFRRVAVGGTLQVVSTALATVAVCSAVGLTLRQGLAIGFVVALSSTAVVLRALADRRELDAPHGKFIVGTLIFQDLCVVPMVLVVPMLGKGGGGSLDLVWALVKAATMVTATLALSRFVVPRLLDRVDQSRSREVFLLAILGLCVGTAWLSAHAGLSMALGAFLAGMVVAGTAYGNRALSDVLPLRDAFVSIFFVSLGMLFDARVVLDHPVAVAAILVAFIVGKGALATLSALAMRFPARVAWLAGVGLAQFGEFGFVLMRLAQDQGLLTVQQSAPLLAAGIISLFITPLLVRAAPHVTAGERLLAPLERLIGVHAIDELAADHATLRDHVVIVGFGLAGRCAAHALQTTGQPFVVLEMGADNVRRGRAEGLPVYYGDATSQEALEHAGIAQARLVVLLTNDPQALERLVDTLRRVAPAVPVLMRTHYLGERRRFYELGARDVVAVEVEGAVEVLSRMLRWLQVPRNLIDAQVANLRNRTHTRDRGEAMPHARLSQVHALAELHIECAQVLPGSRADGTTLAQLRMRKDTGALVVAVRRGGDLHQKPDPDFAFQAGDIAYWVGEAGVDARALPLFDAPMLPLQGSVSG